MTYKVLLLNAVIRDLTSGDRLPRLPHTCDWEVAPDVTQSGLPVMRCRLLTVGRAYERAVLREQGGPAGRRLVTEGERDAIEFEWPEAPGAMPQAVVQLWLTPATEAVRAA
ncbi:hypothetical protein AB0B15_14055 [Streptomyces sp. NPDC045456]|uniref:hypothetical protein n=1 Tax=Streptomyces sp. NPDC045456 TaxID=3155254 RepID=UPI0033DDE4D0